MNAVTVMNWKHERVPAEIMIEVAQPFHGEFGFFFGLRRREPTEPGSGFTTSMMAIGREIMEVLPDVVWVCFSSSVFEFRIKGFTLEQAEESIHTVFRILQNHGCQPKPDGITYRS